MERLFCFHFSLAFLNGIIYVTVIYFKIRFERDVDIKKKQPIGGDENSYTEATKQAKPNKY